MSPLLSFKKEFLPNYSICKPLEQGQFTFFLFSSSCAFLNLLQHTERNIKSDQIRSVTQSCPTLCNPINRSTPGLPVHHQLPEFTETHIHRVSDAFSHLILCRPLFLLPPIPPSIRVFSNESTLRMRWPKYWSFTFSIIPSKEIPGLISFRMDWLDLPAVQGTLKSLLQHHSSKASVLQGSAFFTVQLSHPYIKYNIKTVNHYVVRLQLTIPQK